MGEPILEKAFDKSVTRANKLAKQAFDSSADELADDLLKATKS